MRFIYPWLLLLLSVIPVVGMLWFWLQQRARQQLARLVAPALQPKLMPRNTRRISYLQFMLVLCGLTLLVFATARPQWGRKDEKVVTRGRNLVIALDVSRSMLATDVHPNRLERAKTDIMDLIGDLDGDRAALLAFRSKGSLLCPLTTDYAFLRQALDGVSPESAPRGETNLGDAIRKALETLNVALDEYNAILMISDGEDLKGGALEAAAVAGQRNIPIFTVGIGDESGSTIPAPDGQGVQKFKGTTIHTRLMSKTLRAIADASRGGRYIPLGTAGTAHTTLGAIYRNHLSQIAAKEQQELIENRYQERFQLFLIPAILCLLAAAWFSRGRFSTTSVRRQTAVVACLLISLSAWSQPTPTTAHGINQSPDQTAPMADNVAAAVTTPGRAGARQAQSLLRQGDFSKAAVAFRAAAEGADPVAAETFRYNAAYAYAQTNDWTNAVQILRPLLHSRRHGARAGELLGQLMLSQARTANAADPVTKAQALKDAADAFQRTLRETPDTERCRRNLARAVAPLADARENAHIANVLQEHGQTPPDQLMTTLLAEQRDLIANVDTLFTNDAPSLITRAEALAKRQQAQADLWIPLKQHLLQIVTNQQQQAIMAQQIEIARDNMQGAGAALQDLLPEAAQEVAQIEPQVYTFWKALAMPDNLIQEDILCQSNEIQRLNHPYLAHRDTQNEALELTRIFSDRFPQWADQYIQQAQADTNLPPFTLEDKAKIVTIAKHAGKLQNEIVTQNPQNQERRILQEQALRDLIEIRDLLPKQAGSSQQQQQEQQQEQEQEQQQQNQEQQQDEKQEQKQKQEQKEETPRDVQELLRRALEREKEHEEEKKKRMRNIPLSPSERDW